MRSEGRPYGGWYYRQGGQAFGPVPTGRLKELLASGRLRPGQAVWQRSGHDLLFLHAATAAFGTTARSCPPSPSEPGPA
jgi:GYF domain 2